MRHWSATNGSGMHHVAAQMAHAERLIGLDSLLVDIEHRDSWVGAEWADVHVLHTNMPNEEAIRRAGIKPFRFVFVAHGTPEVVLQHSIDEGTRPGYAPPDAWMLLRHYLTRADAVVTFWDRHRAIYQSMLPKERTVHCVPLGVDTAFWSGGANNGKYAGTPSVWTSENQHRIKWILDTLVAWPLVLEELPNARLHGHYLPSPTHRFFIDLANSNGAAFGAYLSGATYKHDQLRDIWKGLDFFWSPVRYGDHNNLFMQAAATGMKTISYAGNPYADFWVPEGDHRDLAKALLRVLKGEVTPRADKLPVPDLRDMGRTMLAIYESIQ